MASLALAAGPALTLSGQTLLFSLDQDNAPGLEPNPSGQTTVQGVTMSLTAVGSMGLLDQNATGVGVNSDQDDGSGGNAVQRRIDGTLPVPEAIQFSFDTPVQIRSLLLGSFSGNNGTETMVLSFVSGSNPFPGLSTVVNPDFTLGASTLTYTTSSGILGMNTVDIATGIAEPLIVQPGTVLALTANPAVAGGFLFDNIEVSVVPEPSGLAMFGLGMLLVALGRHRQRV